MKKILRYTNFAIESDAVESDGRNSMQTTIQLLQEKSINASVISNYFLIDDTKDIAEATGGLINDLIILRVTIFYQRRIFVLNKKSFKLINKYIPFVFNFLIVIIGIMLPYYIFRFIFGENFYIGVIRVNLFYLIMIGSIFVINLKFKIKIKQWFYSIVIFYLTVFWGCMADSYDNSCFKPFNLFTDNKNPMTFISFRKLEFYYGFPIGILLFSVKVLFIQCLITQIFKLKNK